MSLVPNVSFANEVEPLFIPANDSLTVSNLNINEGGSILLDKTPGGTQGTNSGFVQADLPGQTGPDQYLALVQNNAGNVYTDVLQCANLYMNGGSVLSTPNYLSFDGNGTYGLSWGTVGSRTYYLDQLESGTAIITSNCVGPTPVSFVVGGPFAVSPVPTSPTAPDDFFTAPPYPTVSGEEYDVCCKGTISLLSGTPDPTIPDEFVVIVNAGGGGIGTQRYFFNPGTQNWYVRDRLVSLASLPELTVSVQNIQKGTSTAVYSCTLTMGDIVRVK